MKRILLLLCTMTAAASAVIGQSPAPTSKESKSDPSVWQRYTVKGEEFSAQLPTLPAMTTTAVYQARLGKHRLERQLRTYSEGVVYTIDLFENAAPKQSLKDFIAENAANLGFDPATERSLLINEIAGKEYSRGNSLLFTVQFFKTERRLYRFVASGIDKEHAGMKQFFSSIQFGKNLEGVAVSDGPGGALELNGERIFTSREVDTRIRLIEKPQAAYTEAARANQIGGGVILRAVFSKTGMVTNIQVVRGLPHGLTESAIKAAKQIQFIPAQKDGQSVSMWIQLEYYFRPRR